MSEHSARWPAAGEHRRQFRSWWSSSGPSPRGKSTLAAEVAQLLRARGEAVVVGLDTVAETALPTPDAWACVLDVHGQLVRAWLTTPVRTVIAQGPGTPAELVQLMRHVPADVGVLTAVPATRDETALRRAAQDPGRGLSKDPGFLRRAHDRFDAGRPDLASDLALDGGEEPPAARARRVVLTLDSRRAGTRARDAGGGSGVAHER